MTLILKLFMVLIPLQLFTNNSKPIGFALLESKQQDIPVYANNKSGRIINYICIDTLSEDYPLIEIHQIRNGMAKIYAEFPLGTQNNISGWIEKNKLFVRLQNHHNMPIMKKPTYYSKISFTILDAWWGLVCQVVDCKNGWLLIINPNNPNELGWLAPQFQSHNPYTISN